MFGSFHIYAAFVFSFIIHSVLLTNMHTVLAHIYLASFPTQNWKKQKQKTITAIVPLAFWKKNKNIIKEANEKKSWET